MGLLETIKRVKPGKEKEDAERAIQLQLQWRQSAIEKLRIQVASAVASGKRFHSFYCEASFAGPNDFVNVMIGIVNAEPRIADLSFFRTMEHYTGFKALIKVS